MDCTLDIFKNLCIVYPTWDVLKVYLVGDGLQIKEETGSNLAIIHYRHGSEVSEKTKWFRSVVWDTVAHIPVSVSTARAESDEIDPLTWSPDNFVGKTAREYMDGVTLNLFMQADSDDVVVSSRTRLGASTGFYNKTSFQQMLGDAVKAAGFETVKEFFTKYTEQQSRPFLTVLIQHPEHRVVEKCNIARVHILQSGFVADDGIVHITHMPVEELAPAKYSVPVGEEQANVWFEGLVTGMSKTSPLVSALPTVTGNSWGWRGVCIMDVNGNRWRIHSSVYKMIRSMRGNTSRADERFFNLRAAGMVKTYLQYYPEESNQFWKYEKWMRGATKILYSYYVAVYKSHELMLDCVDARWHTHLGAIHHMYMEQLKPTGNGVHMSHVVAYMNALPTPRLLFLMNLDKRQAV